ncbi:hypothetical protein [Marinagarivorans algicola]|uniref:hypothetical protein n=1 Tax=Marinagarivorans algicola TaxID=1513270 RepID=UPI0006B98E85|nr:hypothetical protein [Marinagarivorans algicola]
MSSRSVPKGRNNNAAGTKLYYVMVGFSMLALMNADALAGPLRDPTTPLHKVIVTESEIDLMLFAIANVGGKNFAIINGQRVYEGGVINGAKIEEINDKYVVYSHKGKRSLLNMRLSLIK